MGGWRLCDGTCRSPLELPQEQETMTPKLWAASMQSCVSRRLLGPAALPTPTPVGSTGVPTGREGGAPMRWTYYIKSGTLSSTVSVSQLLFLGIWQNTFFQKLLHGHLVWERTMSWVWSREGPDEVGRFVRRYTVTIGLLFTGNVTPGPTSL